jgi:hypothetical protein
VKMIWTGTDSLYLVRFPKQLKWTKIFYVLVLRIYAKISDFLVQNHYSCGSLVAANPRMVDECILNGIPYYWSEMGEPCVEEMKQSINEHRIQQ